MKLRLPPVNRKTTFIIPAEVKVFIFNGYFRCFHSSQWFGKNVAKLWNNIYIYCFSSTFSLRAAYRTSSSSSYVSCSFSGSSSTMNISEFISIAMRDEILLILLPNAWWFCLIDFILIIGIVFIVATIMSTIFTTIDKIKTENFSSHGTLSGVRKKKQKQKPFRANSFRNNPQPLSKRLCAKTSLKCARKQATQRKRSTQSIRKSHVWEFVIRWKTSDIYFVPLHLAFTFAVQTQLHISGM